VEEKRCEHRSDGKYLGGGRFEIKGVLHAYDGWKVDNGKPASLRNLNPKRIESRAVL
jgi:hypothetical protein